MDRPAPLISAASWVILDRKSKELLFGKLEKERKEVASLTKIMTMYTTLKLCDNLQIDLDTAIKIDQSVEKVEGTTANLLPGDHLTI